MIAMRRGPGGERRPRKVVRRAVVLMPNGLTLFNLFCGVYAIILAIRGEFSLAPAFILVGGIADVLDGRVARATGTGSRFGGELDSLVDAISFGLAPAIMMYLELPSRGTWEWLFVFIFTACAVMRLARFNIEQAGRKKTYFHGLPSPAAGLTLATYYWFSQTPLYSKSVILFTDSTQGGVLGGSLTGILELLSPAELEGVMAHELAHVRHRDVMIMTIASFFATIAAYIVQFGFFFGGDDDSEEGGIGVLGLILVSLVVYAVSFVLLQALSRYREYAADRGSAIITGRPSALASALLKIAGVSDQIPAQDLRSTQQLKAFYIYWPSAREFISSHPPIEKRIEALQRLEAQLQGVPAAA